MSQRKPEGEVPFPYQRRLVAFARSFSAASHFFDLLQAELRLSTAIRHLQGEPVAGAEPSSSP
jgi:hypothetical protein